MLFLHLFAAANVWPILVSHKWATTQKMSECRYSQSFSCAYLLLRTYYSQQPWSSLLIAVCCLCHARCNEMVGAGALNYTLREPAGIAGIITPWNLPLYLLSFKIAPCLAAGCVCICKPSEMTSLTAWKLCQLCQMAGEPQRGKTLFIRVLCLNFASNINKQQQGLEKIWRSHRSRKPCPSAMSNSGTALYTCIYYYYFYCYYPI